MPDTVKFTLGQRIRYFRERAGLSQNAFAQLVGRGENWAWKVEHDQIPIDSVSMLISICEVLHIKDLADLTGGFVSGAPTGAAQEHPQVAEVRRTLSLPTSLLPDLISATDVHTVADGVRDVWSVYEKQTKDRYTQVGKRLPGLLRTAHAALRDARGGDEEKQALKLLVSLYGLHQIWLRRVGEPTLARIAADRGLSVAEEASDPVLLAAAAWNLSCVLTSAGDVEDSVELARQTIDRCHPGEEAAQEHVSAYGALHLQGAVAAVRATQRPVAWDLFHNAERIAGRLGADHNDWHTCFGPTNVAMHGVHLTAEEGDTSEALRLADQVNVPADMPLERQTRYNIELMNCNRIQRDDYATVHILGKLKKQSPEETAFSPLVREAVTDLLKRERPTFRQELRDIAQHIGVAAAS
ncbi:XRE family transcriptional regulator [Streptomyces sp. WAC 06783]|uniref:helix-turn-helix domain-containing protein n=1 Tax=Streptomyces sp. WAC 06783 TaxID=2203211 RepID=UPI000F73E770|nr:helix-turn-helix transcriptional regulator [Streptomyces sp. WAC 06783]RSO07039.1 XRE family transcriptional regulator [Streptomyces sp. WAC 06783]